MKINLRCWTATKPGLQLFSRKQKTIKHVSVKIVNGFWANMFTRQWVCKYFIMLLLIKSTTRFNKWLSKEHLTNKIKLYHSCIREVLKWSHTKIFKCVISGPCWTCYCTLFMVRFVFDSKTNNTIKIFILTNQQYYRWKIRERTKSKSKKVFDKAASCLCSC